MTGPKECEILALAIGNPDRQPNTFFLNAKYLENDFPVVM